MAVTSQDKKDKSPPKSIKGRRTGRNVLKGKNIRTKEDGTQIFEDYWTEYTSSTDSMDVHLSNCSISSTSDACLSPNTPFTTDDPRDEVTSTMDVTLGSEAVEISRLSSAASTETQESLQGTASQNEIEATHLERTSIIRKQSMQVIKTQIPEQGESLVLETEVMVKRVRKQSMHVMKIRDSPVIEKKPQDSRKQSMIVMNTYDSPEIENDKTTQESNNQRIKEIRDHEASMAKGETSVSETEIIDTNVRQQGTHVMISVSPVIEKEKTQNSRKQSMVVTKNYDSPRIENEITQESRNQSMEIIKDNGTSISENNEENFPATEIEDNLKLEVKSFQRMIHNTPDVQKDGEINKLKETSLKVTGKKEEQNTETMEKDALVQESEKSIPEHNISEFNAVGSNESSRVIKFVDESVMKSKYNKKNKETPQRIRKSCRNRIPPLAYWRGERQLVQYLKSGEMMVSTIYEENDDNKISHKSWHPEKFLQKRNASKQKMIRILNKKNGTKKILLHTHYEDIWPDQYRRNTGFSMVKTLKSSRMSSGFFKIDAGHKTGDLKPKYDMHFVVMRGYVVLNIRSTKLYLKSQDSFKIPKGNTYTLKNYGNSLTVLSFCCEK